MATDDLCGWPAREPEKFRRVKITRDLARELFDALTDIAPSGFGALGDALDEAQGDAENGRSILLIDIVDE
jgi:hypothetical protein